MVSIISTAGHVLTHLISQVHEVDTITPLSLHIRKLSHEKVNHLYYGHIARWYVISGSLTPELYFYIHFKHIFFFEFKFQKENRFENQRP